ncbi:MAG: alpha/beta hydrolase [Rhodospirillum sp.]|nr:alpha/beta hydrolase [Rhodospirillum sp.]
MTRARQADRSGYVARDGVSIYYEVYGAGAPTVLLLPAWSIVHSRMWKGQVAFLARHYRVVTFDGRGNGLSDRPKGARAYHSREFVADAIAVMDATATERAVVIGLSLGGHFAAMLAALHPERVESAILIAPAAPFGPIATDRAEQNFGEPHNVYEGWGKYNRHYWEQDYRGFAEFFFSECFSEHHSTKQIEDSVGWALDTAPDTLIDTVLAGDLPHEDGEALYRTIQRPVLVLHGDQDRIIPHARGQAVAEAIGAPLVTMEGSGHIPVARDPVIVNRLIRDFIDRTTECVGSAPAVVRRGLGRRKRALYLSSPIGLGHARRDLAIADALRGLHPDLEIDWLAQHPVTALLDSAGAAIHPASRLLVNESGHIESEAGEHDLHVFQALRRMDEILVANFMLFQEIVEDGAYDLVIADESWEVDHFWHEHPELKRSALAWFTDFVGYMPMPEGGDREAYLTADYNAEMIEHIARYPRIRDRSIFVGNPNDIVAGTFGPGLPEIRAWTEQHFDFCGYITGPDQANAADRAALRSGFGYGEDEKICIVTVGGSGVGAPLLRRIADAFPAIRRQLPELRMIMVAGPRVDASTLRFDPGIEIHGYVPNLDRQLAACDVALVQGGLTTCMELTAARIPFLYFPLRNHFEQNVHVRHRLNRYGAGRAMDYDAATPDEIADALLDQLRRPISYRAVENDGALRAARMLASMI